MRFVNCYMKMHFHMRNTYIVRSELVPGFVDIVVCMG